MNRRPSWKGGLLLSALGWFAVGWTLWVVLGPPCRALLTTRLLMAK